MTVAGFLVIIFIITTTNSLKFHAKNAKPHFIDMRQPKEQPALGYPFPEPYELNDRRRNLPVIVLKTRPRRPDKLQLNNINVAISDDATPKETKQDIDDDENDLLLKQAADKAFDKNGMIFLTQPKNDPDVPNITYLLTKLVSYKMLTTGSSLRMSPKDFFTEQEMKCLREMSKAIKEDKLLDIDENAPASLDGIKLNLRDDIMKQFRVTLKQLEKNLQQEQDDKTRYAKKRIF